MLAAKRFIDLMCYTALVALYFYSGAAAQNEMQPPTVATDTELVELAAGYGFVEGPAVDAEGTLFFTDLRDGTINTLDAGGTMGVYRSSLADAANGLVFDQEGRLHACEGGSGRITRTEVDGSITVLASAFAGARFNSPNDLVLARDGSIYFTDPYFGSPGSQPQPVAGVYRIGPGGPVSLVEGLLVRPNGLALNRSGSVLYVTNDDPAGVGEIWAFDVLSDGLLDNKRLFATAAWVMDGMAVDARDNLYATSFRQGRSSEGRGVWVFALSGEYLGLIPTPAQPSNCTLAGSTLYITASSRVFSIALNVSAIDRTIVRRATWAQAKMRGAPYGFDPGIRYQTRTRAAAYASQGP